MPSNTQAIPTLAERLDFVRTAEKAKAIGPDEQTVMITVRLPRWRRLQLRGLSAVERVSMNALCVAALEKAADELELQNGIAEAG